MSIKILIIFCAIFIVEGLILPAFFNVRESFLSIILPVLLILYLGPSRQWIGWGLFFILAMESFRGFELGAWSLPFLLTAAVICLIQTVLDIKYTYNARFRLGKLFVLALTSSVFVYLFLFFYGRGHVYAGYLNPTAGLTIVFESLILVFIFNIVFSGKSDYV